MKIFSKTFSRFYFQLQLAANSFCNQEIRVSDEKKVEASKIFLWYKSDFGESDKEVLEKLCEFITDETLKEKVLEIVNQDEQDGKLIFKDYNWALNSK